MMATSAGLAYVVGQFLALEILKTIHNKLGQMDVMISVAAGVGCAIFVFVVTDLVLMLTDAAREGSQHRLPGSKGDPAR